jgi:CHAT domain-containing protein
VIRRELARRPPASKTLAVLADPVTTADDERLQGRRTAPRVEPSIAGPGSPPGPGAEEVASLSFQRLHYAASEAQELAKLVPREQVLEARDFRASRATAVDPALGEFRFLHFATHAYVDDRFPELSALVLSSFNASGEPQDGLLRLQDIYRLRLKADLVSLSACNTALGAQVDGEGLISLTRGFFYAGVPRVIATLWPVDDGATPELMTRAYNLILRQGMPPSEALRRAQLEMWWRREPDEWRHPYYWAGFELHGDWR